MEIDYRNDERLNIVNVALKCNIEIVETLRTGSRVRAICPFCDDTKGHLYLTLVGTKGRYNVYKCVKCGESGTNIDLYSRIFNVDSKTAFKELIGATASVRAREIVIKVQNNKVELLPSKPIAHLNNVYNYLLSMLDLSSVHKSNLLDRGLPIEIIRKNNYKSLPEDYKRKNEICRKLGKEYDLTGVPGFYKNDFGYWDMYCPKGILVPSRNIHEQIQHFQIRLDVPINNKRYKYFSSSGYPMNNPNGCKADAHVHISWGTHKKIHRVGITEGPLKADIARYFTGLTFIAMPGVNVAQNEVVDVLTEMENIRKNKIQTLDVAFDMDVIDKPEVKKALTSLEEKLSLGNFNYNIKKWEDAYKKNNRIKGIDDYLYSKYLDKMKELSL